MNLEKGAGTGNWVSRTVHKKRGASSPFILTPIKDFSICSIQAYMGLQVLH